MPEIQPDPIFESWSTPTFASTDPHAVNGNDVYSLVAGAPVVDIGGTPDGDVRIGLSNGRAFLFTAVQSGPYLVGDEKPERRLKFVMQDHDDWDFPVPVRLASPLGNGVAQATAALCAISSIFAIVFLIQNHCCPVR